MKKTIVLGLGNLIMGDDGVGIRAAEFLGRLSLPLFVTVKEAGTPGLDLLNYLAGYERAIFLDGISSGGEPGSIYRLEGEDVYKLDRSSVVFAHDLGLIQSLSLARYCLGERFPPEIIVYVLEIEKTEEFSLELSESARKGLNQLVNLVLAELHKDGKECTT